MTKAERRERIVHAAAKLFSRSGYHSTSTREIARLAGLSEVTLYRHFADKEHLFSAALHSAMRHLKLRPEIIAGLKTGREPQIMLPKILWVLSDAMTISPELLPLMAVALLELNWNVEEICRDQIAPLFAMIANYFSESIDRGTMRDLNPRIATTALSMTVIAHGELAKIIDGTPRTRMDQKVALGEYAQFWLDVLAVP
jgi:AcrR family transcriptional regulator